MGGSCKTVSSENKFSYKTLPDENVHFSIEVLQSINNGIEEIRKRFAKGQ